MATLAFDVYGTLIDTDGVVSRLREWIGSQADVFSQTWRSKQLEYSFRRGLMRRYENFAVCTRQALDYCCVEYDVSFSAEQKDAGLSVTTSWSFQREFSRRTGRNVLNSIQLIDLPDPGTKMGPWKPKHARRRHMTTAWGQKNRTSV